MRLYKIAPLCGVLLLALAACGCNKLKARDHLNKGVQDYRNAQFQPAIKHFQEAVRLDPSLINARLYLATAYAQQYIPGGDSADNLKTAQQAIDAFKDVLNADPTNSAALASIATIYYNQKKFDEAKDYQTRWLKIEPNNPVPYYWIGVLDWAVAFPRAQTVRKDHSIDQPTKDGSLPVIPAKFRNDLAEKNGALVDEGLKALQKAIELKPNDADSMVYLNLMYRQKAEIDADDSTREADLKSAEDWVNKALAARKAEAEHPTATPAAAQ
ncbi:MAG: tetratricopeptide repeat protein [Acidobacteriota bacterium]|nr:tetratricopeptide repeat protein [Acidobacteriota bacterium]